MMGPDSLLIVGTDSINSDLMIQRLSKRGFNASAVDSSKDALEWIRSHHVDLVLLDVEMEDIHGLELLKTLRQSYTPAQLPIIMVTGRATSEDAVKALASGANDYVSKPIDFPVVLPMQVKAETFATFVNQYPGLQGSSNVVAYL